MIDACTNAQIHKKAQFNTFSNLHTLSLSRSLVVPSSAILLFLTIARDLLTLHDNNSVVSKLSLFLIYSLLVINKIFVLVIAVRYNVRKNEEEGEVLGDGLTRGLIQEDFV